MKNTLLIVLLMSLISCNNAEKKENKTSVTNNETPPKKELIVSMEFKTNKEDDFKLMLNNIVYDEFQRKNIHILEKVMPSSGVESLTANFGDNLSNEFQFNLGNKVPKEVEVFSMTLSYGDNTVVIGPENIGDYFEVSKKFIKYDTTSGKLITIKVNGNHTPSLYMRGKTLDKLKGINSNE